MKPFVLIVFTSFLLITALVPCVTLGNTAYDILDAKRNTTVNELPIDECKSSTFPSARLKAGRYSQATYKRPELSVLIIGYSLLTIAWLRSGKMKLSTVEAKSALPISEGS